MAHQTKPAISLTSDKMPEWKRNLPWMIRLFISAVSFYISFEALLMGAGITENDPLADYVGWFFLVLVAGFVVGVIFLAFGLKQIYLACRSFARSRGRYTRSERQVLESQANFAGAQFHAAELARSLVDNNWRSELTDWSVVLHADEKALSQAPAHYARFYGTDVSYTQSSAFFMGKPAFVAVGLAATVLGNNSRRKQAQLAAQAQWREQQVVRIIATTHRILCQRSDNTWLSFYHNSVSNIDANSASGTLILQYQDTQPLMLGGEGALFASVVSIWALHGVQGLKQYPGLHTLRQIS